MISLLGYDWISIPLIGIVVLVLSWLWSDRIFRWLHQKSLGSREYVLQRLDEMFVETNQRKITFLMLLVSFGPGAIVLILLWPNLLGGVILGGAIVILGWQVPRRLVDLLSARRNAKFVEQMVDGLTLMANGISSGLSIPQTMERVTESMPQPISQEFSFVLSQTRLGLSVEEALNGLAQRVPLPDVQMFVLAINILKETGGNLSETFQTIVETLRERHKIERKIEALTAQGVMQGIIITLVPFVLLIVFLIIDPSYVKPLFSTTLGIIFLFIMLGLQIIGGLVIRNIVKIRV